MRTVDYGKICSLPTCFPLIPGRRFGGVHNVRGDSRGQFVVHRKGLFRPVLLESYSASNDNDCDSRDGSPNSINRLDTRVSLTSFFENLLTSMPLSGLHTESLVILP